VLSTSAKISVKNRIFTLLTAAILCFQVVGLAEDRRQISRSTHEFARNLLINTAYEVRNLDMDIDGVHREMTQVGRRFQQLGRQTQSEARDRALRKQLTNGKS